MCMHVCMYVAAHWRCHVMCTHIAQDALVVVPIVVVVVIVVLVVLLVVVAPPNCKAAARSPVHNCGQQPLATWEESEEGAGSGYGGVGAAGSASMSCVFNNARSLVKHAMLFTHTHFHKLAHTHTYIYICTPRNTHTLRTPREDKCQRVWPLRNGIAAIRLTPSSIDSIYLSISSMRKTGIAN